MNQTLALIKPDAVRRRIVGTIISEIEHHDFHILRIKTLRLTPDQAGRFYAAHSQKPFFPSLVEFICSDQIFAVLLEKENAVEEWRKLIGPTDPAKAEPGTIRRKFGIDLQWNAVHGADSAETAGREIDFFFGEGK